MSRNELLMLVLAQAKMITWLETRIERGREPYAQACGVLAKNNRDLQAIMAVRGVSGCENCRVASLARQQLKEQERRKKR